MEEVTKWVNFSKLLRFIHNASRQAKALVTQLGYLFMNRDEGRYNSKSANITNYWIA